MHCKMPSETPSRNCALTKGRLWTLRHLTSAATAFRGGHPTDSKLCQLSCSVLPHGYARLVVWMQAMSECAGFGFVYRLLSQAVLQNHVQYAFSQFNSDTFCSYPGNGFHVLVLFSLLSSERDWQCVTSPTISLQQSRSWSWVMKGYRSVMLSTVIPPFYILWCTTASSCAQDNYNCSLLKNSSKRAAFASQFAQAIHSRRVVWKPIPATLYRGVHLHQPKAAARRSMSFFTAHETEARTYAKHPPKQVWNLMVISGALLLLALCFLCMLQLVCCAQVHALRLGSNKWALDLTDNTTLQVTCVWDHEDMHLHALQARKPVPWCSG